MAKTILEKILAAREKAHPNDSLTQEMLEEYQVLLAWIEGTIGTSEAADGLGCNRSAIAQKTGTALRNLRSGGYISITWNPKETDG